MSWDISIMRFSRQYRTVAEIPDDERSQILGNRTSIQQRVSAVFPGTNWNDPAWGVWGGNTGSIEFNLGGDDPAESMMLHVRAGKEVVPLIVALCLSNGWQGLDCSSGDFIEQAGTPDRGLKEWSAYRDQVVGGLGGDA